MALNLAAPPQDPIQQTATKRQLPRSLVGDFTLDHERERHRNKILLSRNMARVLAFHEKNRAQQGDLGVRTSTRHRGPYLGQTSVKGVSGHAELPPSLLNNSSTSDLGNGLPHSESDHDTTRPDVESMSKDCLKVRAQMDTLDTPQRRSIRRQLVNQHRDEDAQLNLDLLNIRKKLNFKETSGDGDGRPRKRTKRDAIRCHCHVTIWDNRKGIDQRDSIFKTSEPCEVVTSSSEEGSIYADIKLERPFIIKSRDLRVPIDRAHGQDFALCDNYFLEIKIIPMSENVQWPPVPVLGKSEGDQSTGLGQLAAEKLQGSLVMRYLHLPQAPAQDVPLSVFFLKDGKTYRSKYGLEVKSIWTKGPLRDVINDKIQVEAPANWAIDDDNRPFGKKQVESSVSSPAMPEELRPQIQPNVTFNFESVGPREAREFRRATIRGFQCPACPSQSFNDLEKLQLHFITNHSKYKFTVDKVERAPPNNEVLWVSFKVMSATTTKLRTSEREKRNTEENWSWTAPNEYFNIKAAVVGDQRWAFEQPKKKSTNSGAASISITVDPLSVLRQQSGGFLRAENVPEFRPASRRKYPSTKLNTMTEEKTIPYTSVSHRQRHVSEEPQSETDDEMDNEPFMQKALEALDVIAEKNKWSDEDRILRSKWDRARFAEQLSHPRYLSDFLIRFVRSERDWLVSGGTKVTLALTKLLRDLISRRVINDEVTRDVWFLLHNSKQPFPHVNGTSETDVVMDDASIVNSISPRVGEDDRQHRATILLALPDFSCGICTKQIENLDSIAITCCEMACEAPAVWYHVRCARCKIKDKLHWKCPLCRERLEEL